MSATIAVVIWKDEGDFGYITALTPEEAAERGENPRSVGVPFDPNRRREVGTLAQAEQIAKAHGAALEVW